MPKANATVDFAAARWSILCSSEAMAPGEDSADISGVLLPIPNLLCLVPGIFQIEKNQPRRGAKRYTDGLKSRSAWNPAQSAIREAPIESFRDGWDRLHRK